MTAVPHCCGERPAYAAVIASRLGGAVVAHGAEPGSGGGGSGIGVGEGGSVGSGEGVGLASVVEGVADVDSDAVPLGVAEAGIR